VNDWFDELYENRCEWVEITRRNNFESGIRQSAVDKYADPVHFVYELLQNAEDQEATEAGFTLMADRLIYQHNGHPVTRQDVETSRVLVTVQSLSRQIRLDVMGSVLSPSLWSQMNRKFIPLWRGHHSALSSKTWLCPGALLTGRNWH
jgi:hypothetical protein